MKKKITFVVNSRANYARIKSVISESLKSPGLDVRVVVGASADLHISLEHVLSQLLAGLELMDRFTQHAFAFRDQCLYRLCQRDRHVELA